MSSLYKLFTSLDVNGHGVLTYADIEAASELIGGAENAAAVWSRLDAGGNGHITFEQFAAEWKRLAETSEEEKTAPDHGEEALSMSQPIASVTPAIMFSSRRHSQSSRYATLNGKRHSLSTSSSRLALIQSLSRQVSDQTNKWTTTSTEPSAAHRRTESAAAEDLCDLKYNQRTMELTHNALRARYDRLALACRSNEEENERLRAELSAVRLELSDEKNIIFSLKLEAQTQSAATERLRAEVNDRQHAFKTLSVEHANCEDRLKIERSAHRMIKAEMSNLSDVVSALKKERRIGHLNDFAARLAVTKSIQSDHRNLNELKSAHAQLPIVRAELAQMTALNADLQANCDELQLILNHIQANRSDDGPRHRIANNLSLDYDHHNGNESLSSVTNGLSTDELRRQITDYETRLLEANKCRDECQTAIADLQARNDHLTSELSDQMALSAKLQLTNTSLTNQISDADIKHNQLEKSHSAAVSQLISCHDVAIELVRSSERESFKRFTGEIAELTSELNRVRDECDTLRRQSDAAHVEHQSALTALRHECSELATALRNEREERMTAEAALRSHVCDVAPQNTADVDRLKHQLNERDEMIRSLNSDIALIQNALLSEQAARDQIEEISLSEAKAADKRYDIMYSQLTADVQHANALVEDYRRKIAERNAEFDALTAKCAAQQRQIDELTARLEEWKAHKCIVPEPLAVPSSPLPEPLSPTIIVSPPPSIPLLKLPIHVVETSIKLIALSAAEQAECSLYAVFINHALKDDHDLSHLLPIDTNNSELLWKLRDGLILAKLINECVHSTIDERSLNLSKHPSDDEHHHLSCAEIIQNLNLVVSAAKSIGATMKASSSSRMRPIPSPRSDIGAAQTELLEGNDAELLFDFLHQIIKTNVFRNIQTRLTSSDLATTLLRLPMPKYPLQSAFTATNKISHSKSAGGAVGVGAVIGEISRTELSFLTTEIILLRWMNARIITRQNAITPHFESADRVNYIVTNFAEHCSEQRVLSMTAAIATNSSSSEAWSDRAFEDLRTIGHWIGDVRPSIFPSTNSRMNVLLIAALFDIGTRTSASVHPSTSHDSEYGVSPFDGLDETDREELSFRMWLNSCGIADCRCTQLYADSRDGLLLLKLIDWIQPNTVDWSNVEMAPNNKFKSVSNCNYALTLCKSSLSLSLVGIGGEDIHDGNKKYCSRRLLATHSLLYTETITINESAA